MKIADTGLMTRPPEQSVGKINAQVTQGDGKVGLEADAFPTLLNIPWQTEDLERIEGEIQEAALENYSPESDTPTVSSDHGLLKAIANGLLMNPNLSISITTANEEVSDSMTELERLKTQFEEVASREAANALQFVPAAQLSQEPVSELASAKTAIPETPRPLPQALSATGVLTAGGTPMPKALKGMEHQMIGNPVASASAFEKLGMAENRLQSPGSTVLDNLNKVSVTKSETHHSFLQPTLPGQLPDLISNVAKKVQTQVTSSISNLTASVEQLPKTTSMIEVQLVPKNLGTVQVTVQRQDGAVSVVILTETAAAERLLTNESNAIRESLKSAGLILDEMRVQAVSHLERDQEMKFDRSLSGENQFQQRESSLANRDESGLREQDAEPNGVDAEIGDVRSSDQHDASSDKETGWYI